LFGDNEIKGIYNIKDLISGSTNSFPLWEIPKGKHTIEFKFEPQVVKTGSTIALFSSIGMFLLIIGGVYFERKKKKE
jgi:LPXTG-motif cell wall-anchored protein